MNDYNSPKKRSTVGILLLVVAMVAVVSLSAIGIYKLATEPDAPKTEGALTEQSTPVEQGETEGSQLPVVNIQNYDLDTAPAQVAAKVIPSVVCIQNYQQVQTQQFPFAQTDGAPQLMLAGEGSGVVWTADGYIITNAHVVSGASMVTVVLSDERSFEAKVIGVDADTDLALIKIEADGLIPIELGNYASLQVGDFVLAIGNPGGQKFSSSVTFGIVSAKDRPMDINGGYTMSTIQTDAAINPGNSGGALVDMEGRLVGINSAKYVATGFEGLGFSITIDEALPIVQSLKESGKVTGRSRLGVTGMMVDQLVAQRYGLTPGFYVNEVTNPAAGGLQAGDVIIEVEGIQVTEDADIKKALQGKSAGQTVQIRYWRGGTTAEGALTLVSADEVG